MKIFLPFILFTTFSTTAPAQDTLREKKASSEDQDQVYTIAEQMPVFKNGENSVSKYLIKNIHYPEKAMRDSITGTVFMTFVIDKKGNVRDVKILRGVSPELDAESIRVVESMPPWKPGKISGKAVKVSFNLPIRFSLR